MLSGRTWYYGIGVSLYARGAQQQAGQQIADKKKSTVAVLSGVHVPDYKQIHWAAQARVPALPALYTPECGGDRFLRKRSQAQDT